MRATEKNGSYNFLFVPHIPHRNKNLLRRKTGQRTVGDGPIGQTGPPSKESFFPEISTWTAPTRISVSVKSLSSPRKFAISFIQSNTLWCVATTLSKTADTFNCKRLASFLDGEFSDWPKNSSYVL